MDIRDFLRSQAKVIDEGLESLLPQADPHVPQVVEAMRHSLRGGKRLRPAMLMKAGETFGADPLSLLLAACGVEMVHTATLIHDDLPCIDDSDLRRGSPTCHRAFDEPTALLAGDALIMGGFEALARQVEVSPPDRVARVLAEVARCAGAQGLIAGEAADIAAEGQQASAELLDHIHLTKTAALFQATVRAGAILAGAGEPGVAAMDEYGRCFGLVFQITDDILDVVGSAEELGKPAGADARRAKATYPAVHGLERSRQAAAELTAAAQQQAAQLPAQREFWRELVAFLLSRTA
ncbi:MAG: polyprenyl synthetase family protein [Armatimonadota bacterium]